MLIDDTGIHESAISEGLIRNEMIAAGTISKDKIGFPIVETDENGKVSITEILDGNGQPFGISYTEMKTTISELGDKLDNVSTYNIILGNEYQNIPCVNGFAKNQLLIEIPFAGYLGTTQIDTNVIVGTLPHGVLLGEIQNATSKTDGLIILNVSKDADFGGSNITSGKIPITFVLNGTSITKNFTWSKTNDGSSGVAQIYSLESSEDIIIRSTDENNNTTLSPSEITFSAYVKEGESRSEYNGRFVIQISKTNGEVNNTYLSTNDEHSITYSPDNDTRHIKCTLYKSGGLTEVIEIKTVTVLDDNSQALSEIAKVTNTVTQLSSTVDKNTKAITDKVWSSDITTEINNYDQSTVKTIKDNVSEHTVSIDNITSKVSEVETKIDDEVLTLTEKISEVEQDADSFKVTVSETYATQKNINDLSNSLREELAGLQDQLDGAIESWFYDPIPTLQNEPAINWTTSELRNIHLGDLYYAGNGRCYRFQVSGNSYVWQEVQDTDISAALAKAIAAERLANEKCKVFIAQPIPLYDIGDLWFRDGVLYKCNNGNATGSFIESDWELATDYQTSKQVAASIRVESELITSTVSEKINNLSYGSRNLLMNSKTLIYETYGLLK